ARGQLDRHRGRLRLRALPAGGWQGPRTYPELTGSVGAGRWPATPVELVDRPDHVAAVVIVGEDQVGDPPALFLALVRPLEDEGALDQGHVRAWPRREDIGPVVHHQQRVGGAAAVELAAEL